MVWRAAPALRRVEHGLNGGRERVHRLTRPRKEHQGLAVVGHADHTAIRVRRAFDEAKLVRNFARVHGDRGARRQSKPGEESHPRSLAMRRHEMLNTRTLLHKPLDLTAPFCRTVTTQIALAG